MRVLAIGLVLSAVLGVPTASLAQNQEVAEAIAANLKNSRGLEGYRVGVRFSGGTAVLHGHVRGEEQKAIAEILASDTPGVKRVVNELVVLEDGGSLRQPEGVAAGRVRRTALESYSEMGSPDGTPGRIPSTVFGAGPVGPTARVAARQTPADASASQGATGGQPLPIGAQSAAPTAVAMSFDGMGGVPVAGYDNPHMPGYAWPSYAAYPNYAAVQYPQQYSASAWPYIGPFYPYPQVPLGWRKATLEWKDGWWFLDFKPQRNCGKCWTFPPF